ncbi:MAG: MBL fold metallo-hydrolase [Promethearchaeota archaeon]
MNVVKSTNPIVWESGKVNDYLHLVDLKQFGMPNACSIFIAEFNESVVIIDCGTSMDTRKILGYIKQNDIQLDQVKYIVASHYHFDHIGGLWKLYENVKKSNPEVQIFANLLTMQRLNNFENESHFTRSKKTWGALTGKFKKIEESAFRIIKDNEYFDFEEDITHPLEEFSLNHNKIGLAFLKTPGHSPDHISPLFIREGNVDFLYLGESMGGLAHSQNLKTIPSCVAPDFKHETYMQSVNKIKELTPLNGGLAHYGLITGRENVLELIEDNESLMKEFRQKIIEFYSEKPETRYVFNKAAAHFGTKERIENMLEEDDPAYQTFVKFFVSMIYGMMMDLGYKKD